MADQAHETRSSEALGLILARGGSVGIPRKNVRLFLGEPLITRAVRILSGAGCIRRVVVSTDDPEIAELSRAAGAEVPFLRPAVLAGPEVGSRTAMIHAIQELVALGDGTPASIETDVVLFQATSPCCRSLDIDAAWEQYMAGGRRGLVSVTAVTEPPQWMGELVEGRFRYLHPATERAARRQDLPLVYRLNGAINIASVRALLAGEPPAEEPSAYVMPRHRSADLDDPSDWEPAERAAQAREEIY